jgi:hypothetical protein
VACGSTGGAWWGGWASLVAVLAHVLDGSLEEGVIIEEWAKLPVAAIAEEGAYLAG